MLILRCAGLESMSGPITRERQLRPSVCQVIRDGATTRPDAGWKTEAHPPYRADRSCAGTDQATQPRSPALAEQSIKAQRNEHASQKGDADAASGPSQRKLARKTAHDEHPSDDQVHQSGTTCSLSHQNEINSHLFPGRRSRT